MSLEATRHAWTRPGTGSYKLLLLKIADMVRADRGNTCWGGNAYLCLECGLKERQLQYLLRKLEAAGEIHVARGTGRARGRITFLFKKDVLLPVDFPLEGCTALHPRGADSCISGVQSDAPEPESVTVRETKKTALLSQKGEKPEQRRMTLLSIEEQAQAKRELLRRQYEEAKRDAG